MKIEKKHLLDYYILIPCLILSVVGFDVSVTQQQVLDLLAAGANPFASVV